MPKVTQFTLGSFSWYELATPDAAVSKAFYSALFGWTWRDEVMGPDMVYSIADLDGREAAAMFQLSPQMLAVHVPPRWGLYVTVASADEAVKQTEALGGKVLMGPHDVKDIGRMVIVQDPIGGVVSLWEMKTHAGAGVVGEPGAFVWAQLNASDPERARPFYTALLGWTTHDAPNPLGGTYTTWLKSDGPAGGMMPMPAGAGPSHWLTYWAVADVDASHALALSLGGKPCVPPTDILGMGRFAVLADPTGVVFALGAFRG